MTFADQAAFAKLAKRVEELEAELIATKARVTELETKRGPGRPAKDKEAA
jgi:hypothetical protein